MTSPESSTSTNAKTITEHELEQCQRANQTGRQPVVFVHGLWLLPSSWDRWATVFEDNGYVALTPGWPDDPETVEEAAAHPEVFTGKSIGQVADHFESIVRGLDQKPAIVGHSFGRTPHLRAVPLQLRQRRQRGGGQAAVRGVRGAGARQAAVPGGRGQPEPLDRGQGRHQEPRAGAAADHFGGRRTTPSPGPTPPSSSRRATRA